MYGSYLIIGFIAFRYTKFGTYLKAIGAGEKRSNVLWYPYR